MECVKEKKRERDSDELEEEMFSPEAKRLRENILEDLDEEAAKTITAAEELDRFMKSFENEITIAPELDKSVDLASDSGESTLDLCYLLEATDDELGLPPTADSSPIGFERSFDPIAVNSDAAVFGSEFWEVAGYDDDTFGYGFGYGIGETDESSYFEYVALDGLFNYSDGPNDWFVDRPRFENMPAQ